MSIFWIMFFLLFPALVLYACHRVPLLNRIGALLICYAAGLLLGNLGLIPGGVHPVQNAFLTYSVPIGLPLLFFSLNAKSWLKLAGYSIFAFLLQAVAIVIAATAALFIFKRLVGPETWKALGMLIGCYTGGSINLAAIGLALRTERNLFMAVNMADILVCPFYLLMAITFLQRLLLHILPPFRGTAAEDGAAKVQDFMDYTGFFSRPRLRGLLIALGLALVIFAIGGGVSMLLPGDISTVAAILLISTLGIACSFIPAVRKIEMSFQLGNYFILVFSLALSSLADLGQLLTAAPAVLGMTAFVVFTCVLVHVLLCAIFRIDADTMIITSIAGIFSPPFVPMVAAALRNRQVLFTGVITGIIGWAIGTYLGIGYGYVLRALF